MKKFNVMEVHWKTQLLGGCIKSKYILGELCEKGGLKSLQI